MAEQIHDKGYKRVLSNRRNFLDLLKYHIAAPWADKIDEGDLELVNSEFVLKDFRNKEADIIYRAKINGQAVIFYILLELQSSVDFTMRFRLLLYMVALYNHLFKMTPKKRREVKGFRLPAVVPIVLYNGGREWSCVRGFKEYLSSYEMFMPYAIDFEYVLINVNEPDGAELLKVPVLINAVMALDQKGDNKELIKRLRQVLRISSRLPSDQQVELMDWIRDVLRKKVRDKEAVEEIVEMFEKGDETDMTYAIERVFDEVEARGKREGKREGIREGEKRGEEKVIAMVRAGISIDEIERQMKKSGGTEPNT
jgi:predicted transposase/invertase (TIGR01784 family)